MLPSGMLCGFFLRGSFLGLETTDHVSLSGHLAFSQKASSSSSSPLLGLQVCVITSGIFPRAPGSHSGPHVCKVSTRLTETYHMPSFLSFLCSLTVGTPPVLEFMNKPAVWLVCAFLPVRSQGILTYQSGFQL